MKHVCFVNMPIEFYSPQTGGAIATIIAEMSRGLEERGYKVTVLTRIDATTTHPHGQVIALAPCGREDLNFFQRRLSGLRWRFNKWDWPFFDYYRRAIQRAGKQMPTTPDVVVLFNDLASPIFLKELFPQATIQVWLQNEQQTRGENMPAAVAATTQWFTCSGYIRDWTLVQHGFDPAQISVIHSGVNLEEFYPRVGYDEADENVRVLFVGRIDSNKGVDIAVDAVCALRAEGWLVSLTVAGGKWFYQRRDEAIDPYVRAMQEKMIAAGMEQLGHVPRQQIADVFRKHDVVCVLSRSNEPFGLVVLEAMASGCAVVASNRGGLPEACGGAAELVDPDDTEGVRGALRRFLADRTALAEAKRRALKRAQAAPWTLSVDRFEALTRLA